jgi:HD-GYP domain-containing protein (c-di-GMP phosphodiesterase class II)
MNNASNNILAKLYQPLDIAIFSKEGYGSFKLRSQAPVWLNDLIAENKLRSACYLDELFPFIECFLPDFERHWEDKKGKPLTSEVWLESSNNGDEIPLEACAIWFEGSAFLLIKHLGKKYSENVSLLQKARDNALLKEHLESEVIKRTEDIKMREEEIAMRLSNMTCFRDSQTGEHVRRMGHYAAIMGKALGWSHQKIEDIRIAAPMHDIGKIAIKDSILLKNGQLTEDEFKQMQQHTVVGYKMLKGANITVLDMAAEIALNHHEKWDGSGYPNGTAGINIPETARIVAITDIYDALVHKRVYKEALSEEDTIEYLQQISGAHIDPNLLVVFLEQLPLIREVRESFSDCNY